MQLKTTKEKPSEIPLRPGSKGLITICFLSEIILFVIWLSLFGQKYGAANSIVQWLLIVALITIHVLGIYAWWYLERNGWYHDYGEVEIPDLPHKFRGSLGLNSVTLTEDRIIFHCGIMFAGNSEMLYSEIKQVSVNIRTQNSANVYDISLSKNLKGYYKVGDEPLGFQLSAFSQKDWIVLLRVLESRAPEAEFNELAQYIKSGKVPRF